MVDAFKKNIQEHSLISEGDKILLAVSGGLDSVVMAFLFKQAGFDFGIAHCNFQLRGEESDRDQIFVQQLAEQLEVEFLSTRFDTIQFAETHHLSIQVAARQLRYGYFASLCPPYSKIAVAHHSNDNFETVLYNLTKGTGLAGIRGMKPIHGNIIRPLLFVDREAIEKYAKDNFLTWREDSSNVSDKYARNLIRHQVIPVLKEINPNLEQTSLQTLERLRGIESLLQQMVKEKSGLVQETGEGGFSISIGILLSFEAPAVILFELISDVGFSYSDCVSIFSVIASTESKFFYSTTHELIKERERILVRKRNVPLNQEEEFVINDHDSLIENEFFGLKIQSTEFQGVVPRLERSEAWMDTDKLVFPITIRRWKEGDSFQPLGMKGRKKISDFLIDEKVSITEKRNVWVMVSEGEIIWVMGYLMSEKVKLDKLSKNVSIIELKSKS